MFIRKELRPEAIKRINVLRVWVNENAAQLIEIAQRATIKANGEELFKADKEQMKPILDHSNLPKYMRAYVSVSFGNIWLKADICYPTGDYSVNYAKEDIFLGLADANFKTLPLLDENQISKQIANYEMLTRKAEQIQDKADKIKFDLRHLTNR